MPERHYSIIYSPAKQRKFIIRIEDTDVKRNVEGGEQSQLKYLKWLGMDWDESVDVGGEYGPYRQTERLDIYKQYWQDLLDRGLAYRATARKKSWSRSGKSRWLAAKRRAIPEAPGVDGRARQAFEAEGRVASIRFRVPEDRIYTFDDMVKGTISFNSKETGDFVIVKRRHSYLQFRGSLRRSSDEDQPCAPRGGSYLQYAAPADDL